MTFLLYWSQQSQRVKRLWHGARAHVPAWAYDALLPGKYLQLLCFPQPSLLHLRPSLWTSLLLPVCLALVYYFLVTLACVFPMEYICGRAEPKPSFSSSPNSWVSRQHWEVLTVLVMVLLLFPLSTIKWTLGCTGKKKKVVPQFCNQLSDLPKPLWAFCRRFTLRSRHWD